MADIAGIYRDLFGREPDADGLAYWQGKAPGIAATGGDAAVRAQIGGTATLADQQAMMARAANPFTTGSQL